MRADKLCHPEGSEFVGSKDFGHFRVRGEKLLVRRVLEVLLLDVNPQAFGQIIMDKDTIFPSQDLLMPFQNLAIDCPRK